MSTRIDAIVGFDMKPPIAESITKMEELCNLWNLRILSSSTDRKEIEIAIPWGVFDKFFHENPIVKGYPVPKELKDCVEKIVVKSTLIIDVKHASKDT